MYEAIQYCTFYLTANEKAFHVFKWIGNGFAMLAALAIAASSAWSQEAWPFFMYIISNFVWLLAGIIMRDLPLIGLNMFFFFVNVWGIYERI